MSLQQSVVGMIRSAKNRGRMLVSACVTLLVRTKVNQWRKVAFGGTPSWDERNKIIAGFIPAGSSVLDIGCGAQTLKQHLKPGCRYQPCDVIQSSPEVIFCDFNAGIYPAIREHFDYVVCSGVLEYIRKPGEFIKQVPQWGRTVILSYNPLPPGGSKLARLGNDLGWVNHFTREKLENLFDQSGLKWTVLHTDKLAYVIYSLAA
jgi:hypothetical protein